MDVADLVVFFVSRCLSKMAHNIWLAATRNGCKLRQAANSTQVGCGIPPDSAGYTQLAVSKRFYFKQSVGVGQCEGGFY